METCGNFDFDWQNAEKNVDICGNNCQNFCESRIKRLKSVECIDRKNECGLGKRLYKWGKPCLSAKNLWKTMWILWKYVGKTLWNRCVNGQYAVHKPVLAKNAEI